MACFARSPEDRRAVAQSKAFDEMLQKDGRTLLDEIKLLLLGPGESGKSTVFKQMKIIQKDGGFTKEEKMSYKIIIVGNCITQMKVLINAAKKLNILLHPGSTAAADRIAQLPTQSETWIPRDNMQDIVLLWRDPGIRRTFDRRDVDFQLNDSASYFFDRASCYGDHSYIPDEQDILRARVRTTGIDEAYFNFDDMYFRMVDVGGQRTERRKWIHCFDSVTSVLFCASLAEYDQRLREDSSQNRMIESLQLFGEICNSTWFRNCSIMLFLNKVDLFKEKIKIKDLNILFPEYRGGKNYEEAAKFLKEKFGTENLQPNRPIYTHFTCAVDTGNILFVFKAVKETILNKAIDNIF